MYVAGKRRAVADAPNGVVNRDHDIVNVEARRKIPPRDIFANPQFTVCDLNDRLDRVLDFRIGLWTQRCSKAKKQFLKRSSGKIPRTGRAAFARAHTSGTMRTKQTRRASAAGTRPKSDGMPYVNPLHLIGACCAAKTSPGRTNDGALFRAEAWRRDARRAAVRGRRTRSRASDEIRAHVAANSATASAPARGNARERTPSLASSCRVASRQNIFFERKIAGIGFGRLRCRVGRA